MGRLLRLSAIAILGVLLAAVGVSWWAARQAFYQPEAYRRALDQPPETAQRENDEFLRRAAQWQRDGRRVGQWEIRFTPSQWNGWLAVDLPQNHPESLPPQLRNPRVAFDHNAIALFAQSQWAGREVVVSIEVEPLLLSPTLLGLRLRGLRAGRLPLPQRELIERVSRAVAEAGIDLEWRQLDGAPVAAIPIGDQGRLIGRRGEAIRVAIDRVSISPEELVVAGRTLDTGSNKSNP